MAQEDFAGGVKTPSAITSPVLWKWIAFGATGMYLYQALKANGNSLRNNPYGIHINTDRVVDAFMGHLDLPAEIKPVVTSGVKTVAREKFGNPR